MFAVLEAVIASSGTLSSAVEIPEWVESVALGIPTMTDGDITLQTCDTSGGTYKDVAKAGDANPFIVAPSGTDGCFVDITEEIKAFRGYLKVKSGASQVAERTISVYVSEGGV